MSPVWCRECHVASRRVPARGTERSTRGPPEEDDTKLLTRGVLCQTRSIFQVLSILLILTLQGIAMDYYDFFLSRQDIIQLPMLARTLWIVPILPSCNLS
jgi:hypothetical protein